MAINVTCSKDVNHNYVMKIEGIDEDTPATIARFRVPLKSMEKMINLDGHVVADGMGAGTLEFTAGSDLVEYGEDSSIEVIIPRYFSESLDYRYTCNYSNYVSLSEIYEFAANQSKLTTRKIMDDIGPQVKVVGNFQNGLNAAYKKNKIHNLSGDPYHKGYVDGERDVSKTDERIAIRVAKSKAVIDARKKAKDDVDLAFRKLANYGIPLKRKVDVEVPQTSYASVAISSYENIDVAEKVETRIRTTFHYDAIDAFLEQGITNYSSSHCKFDLYNIWKYGKLYCLEDKQSGNYGFSKWLGFNGVVFQKNRYSKLLNFEKDYFKDEFERDFPKEIKKAVEAKKDEFSFYPYDIGRHFGKVIAEEESYWVGFNDGFNVAMSELIYEAYEGFYRDEYLKVYAEQTEYYQTHAMLVVNLEVKESIVYPGYFDITGKVQNIGGVSSKEESVKLVGSHVFSKNRSLSIDSVEPSSTHNVFIEKALVLDVAIEPGSQTIELEYNGQHYLSSIEFLFKDILNFYRFANSSELSDKFGNVIVDNIAEEWEQSRGWFVTNPYENGSSNLEILVHEQLNEFHERISQLERGGQWWNRSKNRSFLELLDKLN